MQRLVAESAAPAHRRGPRALMLGVTPEIATMRWPAGTRLLALDASEGMIRNVWPAAEVSGAAALADWAAMPVRDGAYDLAIADAFLTSVPYPDGFKVVVAELRRVLKDDGTFVMREFARPEDREPLDTVFADLREGRMADLGAFIWRLAMALHGDLAAGVRLGDVWDAWQARVPEPEQLMRSLGWPLEPLRQLPPYRGHEGRMWFPTLDEAREVFSRGFEQVECHVPAYAGGDRYPTVVFKPRNPASS
jgi:SAM-dependent methyltransferase